MSSGGRFRINLPLLSPPICIQGAVIGVTDATGRTITVTLDNVAGTGTAPAPVIKLAPTSLVLSCSFNAVPATTPPTVVAVTSSLTVSGGTPPFSAGSDHPRVAVTVTGRTVTVQRLNGDLPGSIYPTAGQITVTDGTTTATATFTVASNTVPSASPIARNINRLCNAIGPS